MKISIIIPAYRENELLNKLLHYLEHYSNPEIVKEIIVVDHKESSVVNCSIANVTQSPVGGRAAQMNFGAGKASGEILYFLHADSFPPNKFDEYIVDEVENGNSCGCFRMKFDLKHPILNFFSWFTRFHLSIFRGGDQSLFVSKVLFKKTGGFDESFTVAEDLEIVKRLKKQGKFKVIQENLITSARKYKRNGVLRLQFIFALIQIKYFLGFPQRCLVWVYQHYVY